MMTAEKMETVIVLAAGLGSRLEHNTDDKPKSLVEVNGTPMLYRLLAQLAECNISEIVIVVGYLAEILQNFVSKNFPDLNVRFVQNKEYAKTGSVYSLKLALDAISQGSTVIVEADVVFKHGLVQHFIEAARNSKKSTTMLARYRYDLSGTFALVSEGTISSWDHESVRQDDYPLERSLKTVNVSYLQPGHDIVLLKEAINTVCNDQGLNSPLEYAMQLSISNGLEFTPSYVENGQWYEIDSPNDLEYANRLFLELES
ncbi:phosphocholine cytidylyltransferase family protein [Microbulbifer sp.]|uniref:phosphocholine cytidylyltransferase family protein n=1 Tax=Microbulbifer sp. TaxID=1908541 RepID=UPI00258EA4E1|nr:phosphocholine cytidylyltransferase family protein [Microbulbifer sp.]